MKFTKKIKQETMNVNDGDNNLGINYKPLPFFLTIFIFTWTNWFIASYFSYHNSNAIYYTLFLLLGLLAPVFVTTVILIKNKKVRQGFLNRIIQLKRINVTFLLFACATFIALIYLAITISLIFGQSIRQYTFNESFSFSAGAVPVLLAIILASIIEEIGWRGYGIDSLLNKNNLFKTSLIFGVFWSLWHLPLAFVKGYNPNTLIVQSIWYVANYYLSIIPLAFILNYMYIKSNRSVTSLIILHFVINLMISLTGMTEFTSCILTVLLYGYTVILVLSNKDMFFINDRKE